jgi:hypothetical protein
MEQRPLRLGDILDDYCPRERRVTNHAVVAMIEEDVRQTRCTTCDAEHVYKGGKAPRSRAKKGSPAALYKEVLAGMPDVEAGPAVTAPAHASEREVPPVLEAAAAPEAAVPDEYAAPPAGIETPPATGEEAATPALEEGPVHRPLIRATLPRIEGQKETRPIPDFTMRQPLGRGRFRGGGDGRGRFRGGHDQGGNGNEHRSAGGSRFGGPRAGGGRRRGR